MKKYVLIFILSVAVYLAVMPLRGGYVTILGLSGELSTLIGFILYFLFTLLILSKFDGKVKKAGILLFILLGCVILELPVRIIYFEDTLGSLPDTLFKILAILTAYWVFNVKGLFYKILIPSLAFIFCIWMVYDGYRVWHNKLSYGTFSGEISAQTVSGLTLINEEGDSVSLKDFSGKYLLLDCWYTYCGVCYQSFPKLQELADFYSNNDRIEIVAVHFWMEEKEEDYKTGKNILTREKYHFPTLSVKIDDPVFREELQVEAFPAVLIFDPAGDLVFRGEIRGAKRYIEKLKI